MLCGAVASIMTIGGLWYVKFWSLRLFKAMATLFVSTCAGLAAVAVLGPMVLSLSSSKVVVVLVSCSLWLVAWPVLLCAFSYLAWFAPQVFVLFWLSSALLGCVFPFYSVMCWYDNIFGGLCLRVVFAAQGVVGESVLAQCRWPGQCLESL